MKRNTLIGGLMVCALPWGLTTDTRAQEQQSDTPPQSADEPIAIDEGASIMRGIDLFMYDFSPTDGQVREPTVKIHAEEGQQNESDKVWTVGGVHVTILSENDEDLIVDADTGTVDQEKQHAKLSGGVVATRGDVRMELEAFEWDNEKRLGTSTGRVDLTEGKNYIRSERLVIDIENDRILLYQGKGRIPLREIRS